MKPEAPALSAVSERAPGVRLYDWCSSVHCDRVARYGRGASSWARAGASTADSLRADVGAPYC